MAPPAKFSEGVDEFPAFAAFQGDELVGFITLTSFAPDIVELYNIYVAEGFRSKGLGFQFVNRIEDALRVNGYKGIISVNSDGYMVYGEKRDASDFYQRNGFSLITRTDVTRVFYKAL